MLVRYGIIGIGKQGTLYSTFFKDKKIQGGTLVAVCDIDKKVLLEFKKQNPKIATYNDYKEMVDKKIVDAILVTVPHYFHPEMAIYCFKKNVHVVVDKPAGVYTKQVREMMAASKKTKSLFGMMFNQRTNCLYRKMRELIAKGEIGDLRRVSWIITDWFRSQFYYDSGAWRATWKGEGGGVLINQCPHQIDLVSWIVGEMPKSVNAFCKYGQWHNIEVEDEVTAYFEYKNGATGVFVTTTGEAPGTNRLEISGTKGKLICENNKIVQYINEKDSDTFLKKEKDFYGKPKYKIVEPKTDNKNLQHIGIIRNFTNAILGKEKLFVNGCDGINGVELMNAIELSGWYGGKKVEIPVNEDEYYKELMKRIKRSRYKG